MNSIRIEIITEDGNFNLVLPTDLTLRIELNSSLFVSNYIPGDKVYSSNLPYNDINAEILKHPEAILRSNKMRVYSCNIYIFDTLYYNAKLILGKITNETYPFQIVINPFAVDFKNKKIAELVDEDINIGNTTDDIIANCNAIITKDYPETFVQFPSIGNDDFYGQNNPDFKGVSNAYRSSVNSFVKNEILNAADADNFTNICPQPYFIYIFEKIFESIGYKVTGAFKSDDFIKKLLIFSNFALDKNPDDKYFLNANQTGEWTKYYTYSGSPYTTLIHSDTIISDINNCFDTVNFEYEIKHKGFHEINVSFNIKFTYPIYSSNFKIQLFINSILIEERSGYTIPDWTVWNFFEENFTYYADASETGHLIQVVINWTTLVDINLHQKDCKLKITNASIEKFNIFNGNFNINELLPDISISDFINDVKRFFGLAVFFDFRKQEVAFEFANDIVNSTNYIEIDKYVILNSEIELNNNSGYTYNYDWQADTLASHDFKTIDKTIVQVLDYREFEATVGNFDKIYYIKVSGRYMLARKDDAGNYMQYSDAFYPKITDEGTVEVKPGISPMLMRQFDYYFDMATASYRKDIELPAVKATGTSIAYDTGANKPPFKLNIWHGLQNAYETSVITGQIPFASPLNYNLLGTVIGDRTLQWETDEGMFYHYHKIFDNFIRNAESIRVIAYFPAEIYFKITELFGSKTKIRKLRYKGVNFIPERISAIAKNNSETLKTEIIMLKSNK